MVPKFIILAFLILGLAYGFAPAPTGVRIGRSTSLKMMNHMDILEKIPTLLTALEEAKPDDYQYGACPMPNLH
jgi:hypothetical protein